MEERFHLNEAQTPPDLPMSPRAHTYTHTHTHTHPQHTHKGFNQGLEKGGGVNLLVIN